MDVCAEPRPPHALPADDPAEEEAFYRAAVRRVTEAALDLVESVETDPELTNTQKAEAIERLARVVRRNALLARHLRQPPAPPPRGGTARPPECQVPLEKLSDAELEALLTEHRDRLDSIDPLEDVETDSVPDLINRSCRDLGLPPLTPYDPFRQSAAAHAPEPAEPARPAPPAPPSIPDPQTTDPQQGAPPPTLFPKPNTS